MKKYNIAVVGATGMVGTKFLEVLEEKKQNSNPEEFKQVKSNNGKHAKLSPAATVLLTIAATLGIIVLGTAVYALITLIK